MRSTIRGCFLAFFLVGLLACNHAQENSAKAGIASRSSPGSGPFIGLDGDTLEPLIKPEAEWEKELGAQEYMVLRQAGTERAFTGKYWNNKKKGIYVCAGCGLPLFSSETKFESGTGWPSFYQPLHPGNILEKEDNSYGMSRIEVLCARCGGHQGHVFDDGPEPTGLRYCLNSAALKFVPEK